MRTRVKVIGGPQLNIESLCEDEGKDISISALKVVYKIYDNANWPLRLRKDYACIVFRYKGLSLKPQLAKYNPIGSWHCQKKNNIE